MMDAIRLTVSKRPTEADVRFGFAGGADAVDILINGHNLKEIVRAVEQPFADEGGEPHQAGDYEGLSPEVIFLPSRHLLSEPNWRYADDTGEQADKTAIFDCRCGWPGYWALLVKIVVGERTVTWRDFENVHRSHRSVRPWRYDAIGPFVFDRKQYEGELAKHRL